MKTNYWTKLSPRRRKVVLWILGVLVFYTIFGFLILPPIIRAVAVKELSENLGRKATIQRVNVNPFVPSLTIRGLLVQDKDGQPFLTWDRVYVSFEMSSIFRRAWTFRKIEVTGPFARAQMNKDYTYNFSDLVKEYATTPSAAAPKKASKPLLVRVKRLEVTDARLSLSDYTVRTPFKRVVGPVYLTLSNFCTEADSDGSGYLFGKTDAGEYFQWHGSFCLTPLRSAGNAIIYDVTMNKFKPLYQDLANFEIRSGQSGFCANYRFEWSPSNHTAIATNVAFGISHFRLGLPGDTNDMLDMPHLAQLNTSGDLSAHHGEIGLIEISGANIFPERGTNKAAPFNFLQIVKPGVSKPTPPGGVLVFLNAITNAVSTLIHAKNEWTGIIHEVNFTNCGVQLTDLAYGHPATLDLSNVDVDAKNISNIPNTNITATVSLDWNKNGRIDAGVTAVISPTTIDIRLALDQLDLSTLSPYVKSEVNMFVPSVTFGLNGKVRLRTPAHKLPIITFRGDTWVDHFHAVDGITGDDLLKWDEIRVSGIDANLNPESASIRQISANNVSARVIIEKNGTINLIATMKPAGTNAPAQTKAPAVARTSATTTNAIPPISITTIAITNAQLNFTDRSVTPNVDMDIHDAGGTITGISSTELQHGDLNLKALVDGAPANITGRINPFSGTLTNQVNIFMTNMDLVPASPYSGKYAGYRIAQGALSVDLRYYLVGRQLRSENVITLDQFTFGDKVNSPTATKLPVRLGIAILTDRQGKIVLNVPIQGSLDDPKFRVRKVVERALVNILARVATSPFSLISSVFGGGRGGGGGEDLGYEDFPPASADLTDATKKKLDVITTALYNRPGLQLQISGSVDPVNDHYALQQLAVNREIRALQWRSLRRSQREMTTPDQVVVTPKERPRLVDKLYNEAVADERITPAIIAANSNLTAIASQIKMPEAKLQKQAQLLTKSSGPASEEAGTGLSATHPSSSSSSEQKPVVPTDPKEALLTAIIPVSEDDLERLALNRARTVRSYIISGGQVKAGRLFLAQTPQGTLRQDGSRVFLQLQ